jgi:hypothetical protein
MLEYGAPGQNSLGTAGRSLRRETGLGSPSAVASSDADGCEEQGGGLADEAERFVETALREWVYARLALPLTAPQTRVTGTTC